MSNQWFRFKQFTIQQDRCAMKVGTDGVILGAWADVKDFRRALDIGTGTGLLALMLAQRSAKLSVTALEIDPAAAAQARENVQESVFRERIEVLEEDFRKFAGNGKEQFDLVICNPPYFRDSLKPVSRERTIARHTEALNIREVLELSRPLVMPGGELNLVIPGLLVNETIAAAESYDWHIRRILRIIPVPGKPSTRSCLCLGPKLPEPEIFELVVEEGGRHQYSREYRNLTSAFYL